jgi:type IX secretion system PorP/SprF family membrane protein
MFSQFYAAPLYTNPALAGSTKCGRLSVNYRNQWAAIPGAFSSINASYDQHFDKLSGAVGLVVTDLREGSGSYATTNVGAIYSYSFQVGETFFIQAAVQASYVNRYVNWEKLTFPDQFNEQAGLVKDRSAEHVHFNTPTSINYVDFSTGIVGYNENFYAGFAIHHLSMPDESFTSTGVAKLQMKYTAHAGMVIDLKQKRYRTRDPEAPTISPNIIYQKHGTAEQINYGLYAYVSSMVFGVWYRQTILFNQPESLVFLVGIRHNALNVGYSYDLAINKLYRVSGGSHELSVSYGLPCLDPKPKIKMINCPSF